MTKVPSDAVQTPSPQAPLGPPPVVVVGSPSGTGAVAHSTVISNAIRFMFVIPAIMIGVVAAMEYFRSGGLSWPFLIMLGIQALVMIAVVGQPISVAVKNWRRDREELARRPTETSDLATAVTSALVELGGLKRPTWPLKRPSIQATGAFQELLRSAGAPTNVVIIQSDLSGAISSIPALKEFVEPERVHLGTMSRSSIDFFLVIAIAVFLLWMAVKSALSGDMLTLALMLFALVGAAMQLLKSYGVHIEEARAPVIGMGVLSDHRGRTWSVDDSCVYVYAIKYGFQSYVMSEIVGPDGHYVLFFQDLKDPALTMFWQRWMHPHPRPDLI